MRLFVLASGSIGKAPAYNAYLENVICILSHKLRELFGGVVHVNACTKIFVHMLKCWPGYRFNNVVFYHIILHFSDIL